jgi:hypothetical protein
MRHQGESFMNGISIRLRDIKTEIISIIVLTISLMVIGYFLFQGYGIESVRCGSRGCNASSLLVLLGLVSMALVGAIYSAIYKWRG